MERFSARIETILASALITQLFCERSVMRDPQIRNIFACEISSEFSGTSYDDNEYVLHFANRKLFNCSFVRLVGKSAYFKGVTDFQANEQFEQFFQVRLNEGRMKECFFYVGN